MNEEFKNIEFVFCSFYPVGLEDYVCFFKSHFETFTYLKLKFPHSKGAQKSSIGGEDIISFPPIKSRTLYFVFLPLQYLLFFAQILYHLWGRKTPKKRVFMGVNYFCTMCGIILKKFGRIDFVIYRVMDFFPLPKFGPYRILNRIFYVIDNFCLKNADSVWFTTEGHMVGREKYGYFDRKSCPYVLIPLGLDVSKFACVDKLDKKASHSLVYCGVVSRYHMLDLVFEVLVDLKKDIPQILLNLIGSGPDLDYYRELSKKKGLERNVIFHGFVEDGPEFSSLMSNNLLGIALYKDEEDFMKYTEPAKVKHYLSFGVPALVSDVPKVARELDRKRVCFAVKNDKSEIVKAIKDYFLNAKLQKEYKDNIKNFVRTIDINKMLSDRMLKTL